MIRISSLLAGTALALSFASASFAQDAAPETAETVEPVELTDATADTVVATVNGTDITLGHMIITRAQLPGQYQQLPPDVLFEGILDQLVQQTLLAETLEEDPRRVELAMENEVRSLRAGEVITGLTETAITDETVQDAYDARFAETEPVTEYNASHILVETEEEATDLIARLTDGADFAELAMEASTGPSGPNGGELGWFGPGMMVAPFEEAVVEMEVDQISEPVQTQFGWHVIKLNETRLQEAPPLEQLRPEIEGELQQQAIEDRVAELTEGAEIVRPEGQNIDPALLSDLTLLNP
ncbi:peptidylprolyl isomerase [Aestuariibius insulae]|uniref:peptidylprolyl isomerase n=1 Tax=Aestuariibius insulae TaxID=2058287 RepID=UPI00345EA070